MAAMFIEALPDKNDERRAEEETLAKDTAAVAYFGKNHSTFIRAQVETT